LLFIGNGQKSLARSEHDNSRVTRWIVREKGIVLAGPDPRTLIDEVSPDALKDDIRESLRKVAHVMAEPHAMDQRRLQAFFVTLGCRMLHTLETGTISSKKEATAWALATLDARWKTLIEQAQLVPRDGSSSATVAPAPKEVAETKAFLNFVIGEAGSAGAQAQIDAAARAKAILEKQLAAKQQAAGGKGWGKGRGGANPHGASAPPPTRPGGRGRRG
jgi:hypothetical protein